MAVRRVDGTWRYRKVVRLFDGTKVRVSGTPTINTKLAAEEAERAHIERALHPLPASRKEVPTFEKFFEEFMATYVVANNKPSERMAKESRFRTHLRAFFGRMRLDEITMREVEQFKAKLLGAKLAPSTVNNQVSVVGRMLRYAEEIELIERTPRIKFVKVPPVKFDFLDFEELERLLATARKDADLSAAILCAAHAGLRVGEIRGLEWSDVDFVAAKLMVARTEYRGMLGSPKGGRMRSVPLTGRLRDALKAIRHLKGAVVFCHDDGSRWTRDQMDTWLERATKRAGLRQIGWHVLRHTFCSHLAIRGASPRAIQELAGHASLTTTQRYMHLTSDATRSAVELLDDADGRGKSVANGRLLNKDLS